MMLLQWIEATPVAEMLRDAPPLVVAALSGLHLVGFTLLLGAVLVSSLRMTGMFLADYAAATVTRPAAGAAAIGLLVSVTTGLLLVAPRMVSASGSSIFQTKMLLLVAAAGFQFTVHRAVRRSSNVSASSQRAAGAVALLLWAGVALAGCAFILLE